MNSGFPRKSLACLLVALSLGMSVHNLCGENTRADCDRALNSLRLFKNKVFKQGVEPHWFDGGRKFWYRNDLSEGRQEFILVDAKQGLRKPAFDHARLASALEAKANVDVDPERLPFKSISYQDGGESLLFSCFQKRWECDLQDWRLESLSSQTKGASGNGPDQGAAVEPANNSRARNSPAGRSPDGRWRATIEKCNLMLVDLQSGAEHKLSDNGVPGNPYQGQFLWSPDSSRLLVFQVEAGAARNLYHIESAPSDSLQPKLHSMIYLKPGDKIAHPRPRLFDIGGMEEIEIDDGLFPNPWGLAEFEWLPDSSAFIFVYNQRGHQLMRVIEVDAKSGAARALIDEQSDTFIDYSRKFFYKLLPQTGEIIWMSERDGWNHLYLYDIASASVKNQITSGEWVVRSVERVDSEQRRIWFWAGGVVPGQDPYFLQLCRVDFDGGGLIVLTEGDGTHRIQFSPDNEYFIDTWSRVDMPPTTVLRESESGALVCRLEEADWSALRETGWRPPEPFVAKGRDGQTDIYGIIVRPSSFDPDRSYPIIEKIYAGPHAAFVPKSFGIIWDMQTLAELGFIVVQIDGMGTSFRSKAFHDVCWKNLADSGFPDRIRWIKAASEKYPYMDTSRVGIYGGSAGGQSAVRALIAHGDFYKAAAADCGCHDNRMDKIWWNELWMGWPVGPHYAEQSNVTQASRLQGDLLLTVGELDRNVDPSSTLQLVDALIKADKDFEMLLVPGGGHGVGETPYLVRRRMAFFLRNLRGADHPR